MVTRKQVKISKLKNGDFEARVYGTGYKSLTLGYGRTEKEAVQRLANNLSYYGIGHALLKEDK